MDRRFLFRTAVSLRTAPGHDVVDRSSGRLDEAAAAAVRIRRPRDGLDCDAVRGRLLLPIIRRRRGVPTLSLDALASEVQHRDQGYPRRTARDAVVRIEAALES